MDETSKRIEDGRRQMVPSLLSLAIGAAEIGIRELNGMRGRITVWDQGSADSEEPENQDLGLSDLAVGVIVRSEHALVSVQRIVNGVMRGSERVLRTTGVDRLGRAAYHSRLPGVGSLSSTVADLQRIGRTQRQRGRALARTTMKSSTELSIQEIAVRAIEQVTRSAAIREVIRTETMTASEAAAGEVRDVARAADDRLERAVRSVFRRGRAGTPPIPDSAPT